MTVYGGAFTFIAWSKILHSVTTGQVIPSGNLTQFKFESAEALLPIAVILVIRQSSVDVIWANRTWTGKTIRLMSG